MWKNWTGAAVFVGAVALSAGAMSEHADAGTQSRVEVMRCAEAARNRAVITAFADIFYRQGDIERAMMTYVVPDYIQHSPGVPNGRAAMLDMAKRFAGKPKPVFEVKRVIVDGDIAVIQIRGQLNPQLPAEAVFDMYRLKDGKIVEHWDVRQPVPPTSANNNTMF